MEQICACTVFLAKSSEKTNDSQKSLISRVTKIEAGLDLCYSLSG
jgi:hypothetical protein